MFAPLSVVELNWFGFGYLAHIQARDFQYIPNYFSNKKCYAILSCITENDCIRVTVHCCFRFAALCHDCFILKVWSEYPASV